MSYTKRRIDYQQINPSINENNSGSLKLLEERIKNLEDIVKSLTEVK